MNKFTDLIEEFKKTSLSTSDVEMLDRASDRVVNKGSKDPQDAALHKKNVQLKKKRKDLVTRLKSFNITEEEEPETVAQSPEEAPAQTVDTMSPEGEVFYVDMIKKALFVDLDNIDITDSERAVITHDVTPENAKEVASILNKIIGDYGLE